MFKKLKAHLLNNLKNKTNWLSFLAGISLVFAYAPFSQWWLAILLPIIWLHQINLCNARNTAKQTFIFAFGWFASGISWVHVSIDQFGGLPLVVSLLMMLVLCLYLAIFPALGAYLATKLSRNNQLNLWLIPPTWLLGEYLRGVVLTGFPWLSLGYSQIESPLAAFAPVIGEVGITFVMLLISVSLLNIIKSKQIKRHGLLLSLLAIVTVSLNQITWVEYRDKTIKTALVQANIEQSIKWSPEEEWPSMLTYLDLTRVNYDADLIIWPESAIPAMEPLAQEFLDMANQSAFLNDSAIITGIINYNFQTKNYFNSLIVLGKKRPDDKQASYYYETNNRYYKNHLLPIGEFVPFEDLLRPIAPFFNLPMSSFSRGNYTQPNLIAQGLHILPLICFEIAFPEQLAANMTAETDLILTVSNDAWFGDSHGPHQHLEIARMRALEFGRPLLRSTNNGITAVIDHKGRITAQIPQFEQAVLKAEVSLVTGQTPYSMLGRGLIYLIAILMILLIIFRGYKSKK
ncbi:MAG: apolipoprotein N-acyltransferase [Alteromonadaceae bacterium]|nr:apolipoprotein N-acyltransferase [Alteromonadaceae bacterium]